MTEMVEVEYFGTLIKTRFLGKISKCEPTDYGWRGLCSDGFRVEARAASPTARKPDIPSKLRHYRIFETDKAGKVIGVYFVKPPRRPRRKAKS